MERQDYDYIALLQQLKLTMMVNEFDFNQSPLEETYFLLLQTVNIWQMSYYFSGRLWYRENPFSYGTRDTSG